MKNGYGNLKNATQFGLDLVEYYKSTGDEWTKSNALLSLLGIEDILDRGRAYCDDSEQRQEINKLMDQIRNEIGKIRDADPELFKKKVAENSDRLKFRFVQN